MDTKTKAQIVAQAWDATRDRSNGMKPFEQWESVHRYLDIGFPLAFAVTSGMVTLTKRGTDIIDESYGIIAKALSLDLNKDYESFEDMLDENIMNNIEKE